MVAAVPARLLGDPCPPKQLRDGGGYGALAALPVLLVPGSTGGSAKGAHIRVPVSGHSPGFYCVSAPFLLPLVSAACCTLAPAPLCAHREPWRAAEGRWVPAGTRC